ncbi:DUF2812 domain-containing protein [Tissierella praeacuta]|uniref:DUF2812 domain-containing protein n=1 Tax=Tissierella praeacuta TaxID=43131 RepID=UPI0028AD53CC|nr:DUF2812 domain-containing protein [Tissierella praeacuta]
MTNIKRELFAFSASDISTMEEHFEEMAKKGWMLDKIGEYSIRYKRTKPQELKFCVDLLPKLSVFDYPHNEHVVRYRNLYINSGWNFLTASHKIQVFYSLKEDNLLPIQTDDRKKQSIINKSLLFEIIVYIVYLFILIGSLFKLFPVDYNRLKSNIDIVMTIMTPIFIIPGVAYIFSHGFWIFRAKVAIKNGEKLPKINYKYLKFRTFSLLYPALLFAVLTIAALITDLINGNFQGAFSLLPVIIGITAGTLFRKNKNKKKRSKDRNVVLFGVFIVLVVIGVNIIILKLYDAGETEELREGYKGLTLNDFNQREIDYSNFYREGSILLPKISTYYEESSDGNGDYVRTQYIKAINNRMAKYVFDGMIEKDTKRYRRTATPADMYYDYFDKAFFMDYDFTRSIILLKNNEIFYIDSKFDLSDKDNINIIVNKLNNY